MKNYTERELWIRTLLIRDYGRNMRNLRSHNFTLIESSIIAVLMEIGQVLSTAFDFDYDCLLKCILQDFKEERKVK